MRCPDAGTLHAHLDGELADTTDRLVQEHLASCDRCDQRLAVIRGASRLATERIAALPVGTADAETARARFGLRPRSLSESFMNRRYPMGQVSLRRWRPVLTGVVTISVIALLFTTAPARALARQFLSMFRVERVVGLPFDPQSVSPENVRSLEELFGGLAPQVVVDEPPLPVATVDDASGQAGFAVRVPRILPTDESLTIEVKGRTEYRVPLRRDTLLLLLEAAGMETSAVPADLTAAEVSVAYHSAAYLRQGDLEIAQILQPLASYPDGLDPTLYAEAALRVMGFAPAAAHRLAATIDWTTTLVLPVPTTAASLRDVQVAGVTGIYLEPAEESAVAARPSDDPDAAREPLPRPTLLWEKDGILYLMAGDFDLETLVGMANSMF